MDEKKLRESEATNKQTEEHCQETRRKNGEMKVYLIKYENETQGDTLDTKGLQDKTCGIYKEEI